MKFYQRLPAILYYLYRGSKANIYDFIKYDRKRIEWTILDKIVREGSSEEATFEWTPECSDIRTCRAERLTSPAAFSGIELGMF